MMLFNVYVQREGCTVRPAVRALAVCTQFSPDACNQVVSGKGMLK